MAASLIFEESYVLFHCAYFLMHNDILAMVCHRVTAKVVREIFQDSHCYLQAFSIHSFASTILDQKTGPVFSGHVLCRTQTREHAVDQQSSKRV